MHSAFAIPVHNTDSFKPLSTDALNTFATKLADCVTVICDEISMVNRNMLAISDNRLRQIKGNNDYWGALNFLCFGDFYQVNCMRDGFAK